MSPSDETWTWTGDDRAASLDDRIRHRTSRTRHRKTAVGNGRHGRRRQNDHKDRVQRSVIDIGKLSFLWLNMSAPATALAEILADETWTVAVQKIDADGIPF